MQMLAARGSVCVSADHRRTPTQLRRHYEVETALAARLREAPPDERPALYATVYEELFRRVPDHPQVVRKATPAEQAERVRAQLRFVDPFLRREATYLEIGAGDLALARAVAERVASVVATEVSAQMPDTAGLPPNLRMLGGSPVHLALPDDSVHVAFSNQVMEHLHPEDAAAQLRELRRVLAPGGVYVCLTPNRLFGPHDISKHFGSVPRGLHLCEYSYAEVRACLLAAGFTSVAVRRPGRAGLPEVPPAFVRTGEALLSALPHLVRRAVRGWPPFRPLLGLAVVGFA